MEQRQERAALLALRDAVSSGIAKPFLGFPVPSTSLPGGAWTDATLPCAGAWAWVRCNAGKRVETIFLSNAALGAVNSSWSLGTLEFDYIDLLSGVLPLRLLAPLRALAELNLAGQFLIEVDIGGVTALTALTGLDLFQVQKNGRIPENIWVLRSLQYLNLGDKYFDESAFHGSLPESVWGLSALTYLSLASQRIKVDLTDIGYSSQRLQHLDLSHVPALGDVPDSWSRLTALTSLLLEGSGVSGSLPYALSALTALRVLRMDDNPLKSPFPRFLTGLPNIQNISFSKCDLRGTLPDDLWALPTLVEVDLSYNYLYGKLPSTPNGPFESWWYVYYNCFTSRPTYSQRPEAECSSFYGDEGWKAARRGVEVKVMQRLPVLFSATFIALFLA